MAESNCGRSAEQLRKLPESSVRRSDFLRNVRVCAGREPRRSMRASFPVTRPSAFETFLRPCILMSARKRVSRTFRMLSRRIGERTRRRNFSPVGNSPVHFAFLIRFDSRERSTQRVFRLNRLPASPASSPGLLRQDVNPANARANLPQSGPVFFPKFFPAVRFRQRSISRWALLLVKLKFQNFRVLSWSSSLSLSLPRCTR